MICRAPFCKFSLGPRKILLKESSGCKTRTQTSCRSIFFATQKHCDDHWRKDIAKKDCISNSSPLARARGRGCEILFLATWRPTCCKQWLKKPPSSWWVIISMTVMYSYLRPGDLENAFFTVSLILFSISLNCYPSKGWKLFIWWAQLNTNGHNQTMAATVKQAAWSN